MGERKKTIQILAQSLDRHFLDLGMGPRELVELACALIERATERVGQAPDAKERAARG